MVDLWEEFVEGDAVCHDGGMVLADTSSCTEDLFLVQSWRSLLGMHSECFRGLCVTEDQTSNFQTTGISPAFRWNMKAESASFAKRYKRKAMTLR